MHWFCANKNEIVKEYQVRKTVLKNISNGMKLEKIKLENI